MKVYGKKRFIYGIVSLTVIIVSIITKMILIKNGDINIIKETKSFIIAFLGIIGSLGLIFTSLNKKANEEADIEEKDERNQLINLHINKTVNNIMYYLYWIFIMIFILLWCFHKSDLLLIPPIVLGFLISINLIVTIVTSIYYERKL